MSIDTWKGVFVAKQIDEQPPPHLLCTLSFPTDAIIVTKTPDGLTLPQDVGELLKKERFLFGPFLKEALEKCATTIALLYSSTGSSPKLVTEAKKFAIRAMKLSGDDKSAVLTQRFVDSLQTAAQVASSDSKVLQAAISAFSALQTIALLKNNAAKALGDKYVAFQPIIDVLDTIAMPANVPRRDMLLINKGNLANVYRLVVLGMLYLLDGDLTNAQLNNNNAYAASIYWAQLFQTPAPQQPAPPKKK